MKYLWEFLLDVIDAVAFSVLAVLGLCASGVFIMAIARAMGWV